MDPFYKIYRIFSWDICYVQHGTELYSKEFIQYEAWLGWNTSWCRNTLNLSNNNAKFIEEECFWPGNIDISVTIPQTLYSFIRYMKLTIKWFLKNTGTLFLSNIIIQESFMDYMVKKVSVTFRRIGNMKWVLRFTMT